MTTGSTRYSDYFRRMLTAVVEFMLHTGITRDEAERVLAGALSAANGSGHQETSYAQSSDLVSACLLLDRWFRARNYLDKNAHPRAIKLYGPAPSVQALIRAERLSGTFNPDQLRAFGLITRAGHGTYKPSMPSGVVTDFVPALQYQVAHTLFMLLRTVRYNMSVRDKSKRLIERFAEVPDLSVECADDFREFAGQQGSQLLHTVNHWMESRRVQQRASGPEAKRGTVAGVHVYAYIGEQAATAGRPKSSAKRVASKR